MTTKFDARQTTYTGSLLRASTSNVTELDNLIRSLDAEVAPPLMMRASATPADRLVNISSIEVTNLETDERRTIPPINGVVPTFTSGTIQFPTSGNNPVSVTPGIDPTMPAMGANQFLKVAVFLNDSGDLELSFGTPAASEALATTPPDIVRTFPLGYIVVKTDGSSLIQDVEAGDVVMYVGGGGGGAGGLVLESQSTNFTAEAGKHYLVDTTGGVVIASLPAGDDGAVIRFSDAAQNFTVNSLILDPASGEQIAEGAVDENYEVDVTLAWVQIQWDSVQGLWTLDSVAPSQATSLLSLNGLDGSAYALQTFSSTDGSITFNSASGNHDIELADTIAGDRTFSGLVTVGSRINLSSTNSKIFTDSVDTADDKRIQIGGGGDASITRGAYINAYGNEFAGSGGFLDLLTGNVAGSVFRLLQAGVAAITSETTGAVSNTLYLKTGNVGIGTTPDALSKLHVLENTNYALRIENTGTGGGYWFIGQTNDSFASGGGKLVFVPDTTGSGSATFTLSNTGAVTLGPPTFGVTHSVNGALSVDINTTGTIASFNGDSTDVLNIDADANAITLDYRNVADAYFEMQGVIVGNFNSAGAWTLGPGSGLTSAHQVRSNSALTTGILNLTALATASGTANRRYMQFAGVSGGADGYIENNGSAVLTLTDVSDVRLKKNIVDATYGLSTVLALRPVEFDWDSGAAMRVKGFIAQEVKAVLPESVSVNDMSENGGLSDCHVLETQTMIPVMVKAIQELNAKIEAAEARITQLEGTP